VKPISDIPDTLVNGYPAYTTSVIFWLNDLMISGLDIKYFIYVHCKPAMKLCFPFATA